MLGTSRTNPTKNPEDMARVIEVLKKMQIDALVSIVGLALVVFGLIESDLRNALGPDEQLEGLLPEGRAARPTGRNILAAFQGLGLTYGPDGIALDRLTRTQRRILELLEVTLPWPEQARPGAVNCGKRA